MFWAFSASRQNFPVTLTPDPFHLIPLKRLGIDLSLEDVVLVLQAFSILVILSILNFRCFGDQMRVRIDLLFLFSRQLAWEAMFMKLAVALKIFNVSVVGESTSQSIEHIHTRTAGEIVISINRLRLVCQDLGDMSGGVLVCARC